MDEELTCENEHRFAWGQCVPRVVLSQTGYTEAFGEQWNKYRVT